MQESERQRLRNHRSEIAAEQIGRRTRLMELDPRYCDVIVKRWKRFTDTQGQRICTLREQEVSA